MHFKSHRLRKGRYSSSNHTYLITTVTRSRTRFFVDFTHARIVVHALKHADDRGWSATYAFVLMPDHLHWLFQLGQEKSLSELMHSMKSYTAHQLLKQGISDVWQDGFHDHAIRDDEDLRVMARYVVANPLRAGLVKNLGDYPWWDARWL